MGRKDPVNLYYSLTSVSYTHLLQRTVFILFEEVGVYPILVEVGNVCSDVVPLLQIEVEMCIRDSYNDDDGVNETDTVKSGLPLFVLEKQLVHII